MQEEGTISTSEPRRACHRPRPPLDPATHAHAFPYEPGSEPPLITGDCECGMTYEEYQREREKDPWWSGTEARTITEAQAARDGS